MSSSSEAAGCGCSEDQHHGSDAAFDRGVVLVQQAILRCCGASISALVAQAWIAARWAIWRSERAEGVEAGLASARHALRLPVGRALGTSAGADSACSFCSHCAEA